MITVRRNKELTTITITIEVEGLSKSEACKLLHDKVRDNTIGRIIHRCPDGGYACVIDVKRIKK